MKEEGHGSSHDDGRGCGEKEYGRRMEVKNEGRRDGQERGEKEKWRKEN